MNDKEYRYNALHNNTFDLQVVEDSIKENQLSSFKYLYNLQLISTGYKRFDFRASDLFRSNTINHLYRLMPRRWVLYIEDDFIHEGKRLTYKRSKFYDKEISYLDTINNKDVFTWTFMLFIDGVTYFDGIRIICKEDKTYVVFNFDEKPMEGDGLPKETLRDYIERDVPITVYFVPNHGTSSLDTNAYVLKDHNTLHGLPYSKYKGFTKPSQNSLVYAKNQDKLYGEIINVSFGHSGLYVPNELIHNTIQRTPNDTKISLNIMDFKHLLQVIEIPEGEFNQWFELPIKDYPIAVDNCIVFDTDGNYKHEISIDIFYPNIYRINNNVGFKALKIYVFYFESSTILQHKNALETYFRYTKNVLDMYKYNTVNETVRNYMPKEITYDHKDYFGSQYYDNHFMYKVEKMRSLCKEYGEYFRTYLKNLGLKNKYLCLDISKIENLDSRIRLNNKDTGESYIDTFETPHYMFVFRNEFRQSYDELTVTIDGIRFDIEYLYKGDKLDYLYLPTGLVKPDSIIEIEKLKETNREYDVTLSLDKSTVVTIDDKVLHRGVMMNDLFLIDPETDKYISKEDYSLFMEIDGEKVDIVKEDIFFPLTKTVELQAKNNEISNKKLLLCIKKNYRHFELNVSEDHDIFSHINFKLDTINDNRHIKLYRNGKLLPRHIFAVRFPEHYFVDDCKLYPGVIKNIGDVFKVESMPYKMKQICCLEKLEQNKIVNLEGLIDKPFDLRWFDVYLNGTKLTKFDIEVLSCNKIAIRDVSSLKWLEVVQNFRDEEEYFGNIPISDIMDDILNNDKDLVDRIEGTITDMEDIEEDIVGDIVTEEDVDLNDFYWNFILKFGLINPDLLQIPEEEMKKYPSIFDGEPFLLNPDYGKINCERILRINSDDVKEKPTTN